MEGLRIRHYHTLPVSTAEMSGFQRNSYTMEAWVCPAPLDRKVRFYEKANYNGRVVRLAAGAYRSLSTQHLKAFGSVCLPINMEVIGFPKPDFGGKPFILQDDATAMSAAEQQLGSVVIIDQYTRRQKWVVLFSEPNYSGTARVLEAGTNYRLKAEESFRSAWLPPGVKLSAKYPQARTKDVIRTSIDDNTVFFMLDGGTKMMPSGGVQIIDTSEKAKPYTGVKIPDGQRGILYERADFGGRRKVFRGTYNFDFDWQPSLLVHYPSEQALNVQDGVIVRDNSYLQVYPAGTSIVDAKKDAILWIPPGFRMLLKENAINRRSDVKLLKKYATDRPAVLSPGHYAGIDLNNYQVEVLEMKAFQGNQADLPVDCREAMPTWLPQSEGEQAVEYNELSFAGILTRNKRGFRIELDNKLRRPGMEKHRFGGFLLQPDRWYHLAQVYDGTTLQWIVDGRSVKESTEDQDRPASKGDWQMAVHLRGSVGRLRVWKGVLDLKTLKQVRFLEDALLPEGLPKRCPLKPMSDHQFVPDAVSIDMKLPLDPARSGLARDLAFQQKAKNDTALEIERKKFEQKKSETLYQGQLLKEQAIKHRQRKIHTSALDTIIFCRGREAIHLQRSYLLNQRLNANTMRGIGPGYEDYPQGAYRLNDLAMGHDDHLYFAYNGAKQAIGVWTEVSDGTKLEREHPVALFECNQEVLALRCDRSGRHPLGKLDDQIRDGIYWIEADGRIYRNWVSYNSFSKSPMISDTESLGDHPSPYGGNSTRYDMDIFLKEKLRFGGSGEPVALLTIVFWTNGHEIFRGVETYELESGASNWKTELLLPHAVAGTPIALRVTDNGSLVWIDEQTNFVHRLPSADRITEDTYRWRHFDLFPVSDPGNGLALTSVKQNPNDTEAIDYLYWSGTVRQSIEMAVIDTPGRFVDLCPQLIKGGSHGQRVGVVPLNIMANVKIIEEDYPIHLPGESGMAYGRLEVQMGYEIELDIFLYSVAYVSRTTEIFQFGSDSSRFSLTSSGLLGQHGQGRYDYSQNLSENKFIKLVLKVEEKKDTTIFQLFEDGKQLLKHEQTGGDRLRVNSNQVFFNYYPSRTTAFAQFRYMEIRSLDTTGEVLARRSMSVTKGVNEQWPKNKTLPYFPFFLNPAPGTTPLMYHLRKGEGSLADLKPMLTLDPVRINFEKGFTLSAQMILEDDPFNYGKPICVYELASFDAEQQLVCAIDQERMPVFYLRRNGKPVPVSKYDQGLIEHEQRVLPNKLCRVTWCLAPDGTYETFVNGVKAQGGYTGWTTETRHFSYHQVGSSPEYYLGREFKDARYYTDEEEEQWFFPFHGKIVRLSAWNDHLPSAARSDDGLSDFDPTWDRSVLTVETSQHYLHAGRLDGKESPIPLYPLDIDAGLTIVSKLDHQEAELSLAHEKLAASKKYAMRLKQEALARANARMVEVQQQKAEARRLGGERKMVAQKAAALKETQATQKRLEASAKVEEINQETQQKKQKIKQDGQNRIDGAWGDAKADRDRKLAPKRSEKAKLEREHSKLEKERDKKRR